jgi:hypothetical protein
MNKAPAERFGSAREMRAALRASNTPRSEVTPRPVAAPQPPAPTIVVPLTPQRRGRGLAAASLAAMLAAGAAYLVWPGDPPPAPPAPIAVSPPAAVSPAAPAPVSPAVPLPAPAASTSPVGRETAPAAGPERSRSSRGKRSGRPAAGSETRVARPAEANNVVMAANLIAPSTPVVTAAAHPEAPLPPRRVETPPPSRLALSAADVDRARVSITGVNTSSGIPGSNIRAAMNRLPLARCYRDALHAAGAPASGTATLHLKMDVSGYVTAADLADAGFLPGVRGCIEQAARSMRIKDVDTGEASAVVTLSFACAP